jgi:AraC-like DNA-binding protein
METLFSIVSGGGFLQGLFVAALLLSRPPAGKGRSAGDITLAALMLAFSANVLYAGFLHAALRPEVFPSYEPFLIVIGPLFFLYMRLVSGAGARARRFGVSDALHFAPAILLAAIAPLAAQLAGPSGLRPLSIGFWAASVLYMLVYVLASGRLVHDHRLRLREEYSEIGAADLGWARGFMLAFLALEVLGLVLLIGIVSSDPFVHLGKALSLASSLLAYGLGYRCLSRRIGGHRVLPLDEGAGEPVAGAARAQDTVPGASSRKYARSGLGEGDKSRLASEIEGFMETEKPWLDSEFSLQDLAQGLGRNRNQLSQVINESFGTSFYDYVNGYRIREVIRLMADPGRARHKILSLALDSGFASKNTFNAAFKKASGLTPSRYRSGLEKTEGGK